MRNRFPVMLTTSFALALLVTSAQATARLVSVTPVDGGCVAGPTGSHVEAWDVEPLKTYAFTIDNVTECSGATINVMVQNWYGTFADRVATLVSEGVYRFEFTTPASAARRRRSAIASRRASRAPATWSAVTTPGSTSPTCATRPGVPAA